MLVKKVGPVLSCYHDVDITVLGVVFKFAARTGCCGTS
jgi:hypothetical protein